MDKKILARRRDKRAKRRKSLKNREKILGENIRLGNIEKILYL